MDHPKKACRGAITSHSGKPLTAEVGRGKPQPNMEHGKAFWAIINVKYLPHLNVFSKV